MQKSTRNFWLLFIVSLVISILIITLFVRALQFILYLLLVLALTPLVYLVLRLMFPGPKKDEDDKLKTRD